MSRVRADTIINKSGDGAPDFPYGVTLSGQANLNAPAGIASFNQFVGNLAGIATITGGTIVSGAGTFSGPVKVTDSTDSTSITTGSLIISGGVGIAKSVFIGNNLSVGGTVTYEDVTNVDSVGLITAQTGIKVTAGGIDITAGGLDVSAGVSTFASTANFGGAVTITDTTESTSKDTGSLIINGGFGCEKNLNVGTAVTMDGAGIATFSQGMKVGGGNALQEKVHINTTAWSASVAAGDINLDYGMTHLNTAVLAGTGNTLNVTSSTGINTAMAVGDIMTVTGITSVSSGTSFVNTLKIDHTTVQVAWLNGITPSEGGNAGYDVYAFNIVKTASAKYAVIGNHIMTSDP